MDPVHEGAYREKLADAWWHIYRMIGKLEGRIYILARQGHSRPSDPF